jgi:hypothetical protein
LKGKTKDMKKKTQVILGLSAIVAVTAGVAGASTFAWFTTQRVASVNVTSATIFTTTSTLEISYGGSTDGSIDDGILSGNVLTVTGTTNAKVTDISGNGKNFYRPAWVPGGEGITASTIDAIENQHPASTDYYYLKFALTVTNTGNADMPLYLNSGSSVFAHGGNSATDASKLAAKATRVAILDGNSNLITQWQFNTSESTEKTHYSYIAAQTGGNAYHTVSNYGVKNVAAADNFHLGDFTTVQSGFNDDNSHKDQYLCTLTKAGGTAASKSLQVVLWLEGTSTYATNTNTANAVGGVIDAKINIAGI